jgi:hypothetical protein
MKIGIVKISDEMYLNYWGKIYVFMKDFRPVHIEFRYWENKTWCIYGISDLFEDLKEGESPPEYTVWFENPDGRGGTYKFERINKK